MLARGFSVVNISKRCASANGSCAAVRLTVLPMHAHAQRNTAPSDLGSEERDLTPEMEQRIEPMQSDFNQVEMERRF